MRALSFKFDWNSEFSMAHRKGFLKTAITFIDGVIFGAFLQAVGSSEVISGHLQSL